MKRRYLSLLFLPILACGLISFDLDQEIAENTVKGIDLLNPALDANTFFPPMALSLNLDQEIAARETGPASAAYLKAITLEITDTAKSNPSDDDSFDFFQELQIFIEAKDASLPKKKLAFIKDFSAKSTVLNLGIDESIDLLPYINAGAKISCAAGGLFPPKDDVSYKGKITVTIKI